MSLLPRNVSDLRPRFLSDNDTSVRTMISCFDIKDSVGYYHDMARLGIIFICAALFIMALDGENQIYTTFQLHPPLYPRNNPITGVFTLAKHFQGWNSVSRVNRVAEVPPPGTEEELKRMNAS